MIKVKKKFLNVVYWVLGVVINALAVALSTKSNLGISTLSSTPYVIHVWIRDAYPFFTQGTTEYIWQGVMLIATCIACRKCDAKYLLAFVTAVISGFVMDGFFFLLGGNGPCESMILRVLSLLSGLVLLAFSIACYFKTTLPLKVYEFTVVEVSKAFKFDRIVFKRCFDAAMFILSLILAYFLNHNFNGLGIGTVVITLFNAPLIGFFGKHLDKIIRGV